MDDYIKREDAVERIKADCDRFDHIPKRVVKFFTLGMESVPSADVVEVVRCKECKEYIPWMPDGTHICMRLGNYYGNTKPNDYCSYGERKEQEND